MGNFDYILVFAIVFGGLFLFRRILRSPTDQPRPNTASTVPEPPSEAEPAAPEPTPTDIDYRKVLTRGPWRKSLHHVEFSKKNYDRYMRSSAWQLVRNRVLSRAESICEQCKRSPATAVAHDAWPRINPRGQFEEAPDLSNLVALCSSCSKERYDPSPWDDPTHPFWPEPAPSLTRSSAISAA